MHGPGSNLYGPGGDVGGASADSTPFVSVLPTPSHSPPPGGHSAFAPGHGAIMATCRPVFYVCFPGHLALVFAGELVAVEMHGAGGPVHQPIRMLMPRTWLPLQVFMAEVPEPQQPCTGSSRRSWPRVQATAVRVKHC